MSSHSFQLNFTDSPGSSNVTPAPCVDPVPAASEAFISSLPARGQAIYVGSVFPLRHPETEPTFKYVRRVDEDDSGLASIHYTRDAEGAIVLAECARHAPDYTLSEYTLYKNQLGQQGTVRVHDGGVSFSLTRGAATRSRTERHTEPVAVGPTLVGLIFQRLTALRAGAVLRVRFALLEHLRTIGFELRSVPAPVGQTRVRMVASNFLIGLIVRPLYFTFDSATGKLVRLEGRVPPKVPAGKRWRDFDARVEYEFIANEYR
jgi:hypothetical protein